MKKSLTVNNSTYASNPGNLKLNHWVWVYYNFVTVSLLFFFFVGALLLTVYVSPIFILLLIVASCFNYYYWVNKQEHFSRGDSNGGLVISTNPTLVAVATDMTKGFGKFPIVKIIKVKSRNKLLIGDKIGTVALYRAAADPALRHWIGFNPIPIDYATKDKEVIARVMSTYSDVYWANLKRQIEQINQPYQEGIFRVDIQHSNWPK